MLRYIYIYIYIYTQCLKLVLTQIIAKLKRFFNKHTNTVLKEGNLIIQKVKSNIWDIFSAFVLIEIT